MADEKRISIWLSIKDGVSAAIEKISKGWSSSIKAMKESTLFFTAGLAGLVAGVYKSVVSYGEQEKAVNSLNAALENQGKYTAERSKDLQNYATALQSTTTFGDEAIMSVETLLVSFGLEGEILKKATAATLDLAVAQNMDLNSAGQLVAKTIGSDVNALGRYGIKVEGTVGSTERAAMAIENLGKKFGGRAAAEADTFAGKVEQIKNQVGDTLEVIGKPFADALTKVLAVVSDVVKAVTPWIEKNATLVASVTGLVAVVLGLLTAFGAIVTIAPTVAAAWVVMTGPIGIISVAIGGLIAAVTFFATSNSEIAKTVRAAWDTIGTVFSQYGEALKSSLTSLGEYLKGFGTVLAGVFSGNLGKILEGRREMVAASMDTAQAFSDATDKIKTKFDEQLAKERETLDASSAAKAEAAKRDREAKDAEFVMDQEFDSIRKAYEEELAAERLAFEQSTAEERIAYLTQALGAERIAKDAARIQEAIAAKNFKEAEKIQNQMYNDAFLKMHADKLAEEAKQKKASWAKNASELMANSLQELATVEMTEEQKRELAEGTSTFISGLTGLMRSKNRTAFEVGKKAAQAEALINTYLSAQKAFSSLVGIPVVGPALAGIAAAAAVVSGLENVRRIENTSFQAAGGAYAAGDGVTAKFGEPGNPEWILNEGNLRAILREAQGNVTVRVYIGGSELRPAIVEIEREKQRMTEAGIL